jgi:hypothetical protein
VTQPLTLVITPVVRHAVAGLPWWRVIQLVSELIGTAIVLAAAVYIGRRRLLLAWHGARTSRAVPPGVVLVGHRHGLRRVHRRGAGVAWQRR